MNINFKTLIYTVTLFSSIVSAQSLEFGPKKENQGKLLDKIVAYVGTGTVTQSELKLVAKSLPSEVKQSSLLNRLITTKLLLQAAKKRNIIVNDTMVDDEINREAKKKGLSRSDYIEELSNSGLAIANYRKQKAEILTITYLQQVVGRSLVDISEREINDRAETFKNRIGLIELKDIFIPLNKSNITRTEADSLANQIYIDASKNTNNIERFQSNRVVVNNIGLVSLKRLPGTFVNVLKATQTGSITKPILDKDGYHIIKIISRNDKSSDKRHAFEYKVKHILIKEKNKTVSEIDALIEKIKNELANGIRFSTLAGEYSDDQRSAKIGGSLGWVKEGETHPEFEKIISKIEIGVVSSPIKTSFGIHLIKVLEKKSVAINADEETKTLAAEEIFDERIGEAWSLWVERLREETFIKIVK